MRRLLTLTTVILIALLTLPVTAQNPPDGTPVTTVNGTPISPGQFQVRVQLEAWLTAREIGGFARTFYAQNPSADEMLATIRTVYGVQLNSLADAEAFAETVLNSLEVDAVLRGLAANSDVAVSDAEIEALMLDHIAKANGATAPAPDANSIPVFLAEAAVATGASETEVRALFEGRALREVYFRAVTGAEPGAERTRDQNAEFQAWAFAQVQSAQIERRADWAATAPAVTGYTAGITEVLAEVIAVALLGP
jgi:hypothetical protein